MQRKNLPKTSPPVGWKKSSFSGGNDGGDCVEVTRASSRRDNGGVLVRNSRHKNTLRQHTGPEIYLTRIQWQKLQLDIVFGKPTDKTFAIFHKTGEGEMDFTPKEWHAFCEGVKAGEFSDI